MFWIIAVSFYNYIVLQTKSSLRYNSMVNDDKYSFMGDNLESWSKPSVKHNPTYPVETKSSDIRFVPKIWLKAGPNKLRSKMSP